MNNSQKSRLEKIEATLKPDKSEPIVIVLHAEIVGKGGEVLDVREKRVEVDAKWLKTPLIVDV